jgi:tetratricopeptide (TPR) repeat protein
MSRKPNEPIKPDILGPEPGLGSEGVPPEQRETRLCSTCGSPLSTNSAGEFCLVCMRRMLGSALSDSVVAIEQEVAEAPDSVRGQQFGHYELVMAEDGSPIELGRGAMGITYKAFDVDLRLYVTLKVISERYVGDESARARFLREARAAAKVRHSNVASVFLLGKSGRDYFYAMEFVEGETLDSLVKRSGRLEVELALEIASQMAAGLAAVHKQKLVHRDIKPSNIMVSLEVGGGVTAKINDLGLAKAVNEPSAETAISTPGSFTGTPEFASPEQFAGIGVDIRSDLYSLGVTLWEMLTGRTPFQGSPSEVMHHHMHTALPLEQLKAVPQPVIALLELLLEKDPGRRFQTPDELLRTIPTIRSAIGAGRTITYQSVQKMPPADSGITWSSSASTGPERISVARLPVTGSDAFGREDDIAFLDAAWANRQINVVTIVAWAGAGKSTLVNHWLQRMSAEHYRSAELVFGWSFYRQGTSGCASFADEFLDAVLTWFGDPDPRIGTAWEKGERLAKLIAHRRTLLILDGLEPLQHPPGSQEGRLREPSLQALLRELAAFNKGLCVITSRMPVADIAGHEHGAAPRRELEQLSADAGAKLLRALGVKGHENELRTASDEFRGHSLALTLLGSFLTDAYEGDIRRRQEVSARLAHDARQGVHARRVMESYQTWFGEGPELSVLRVLGQFDRPVDERAIGSLLKPPAIAGLTDSLTDLSPTEWRTIIARLRRARLLAGEDLHNRGQLDTHPLVREYFGEQLRIERVDAWKECNRRLYHYYRTIAPQLPDSFREMEPLFLAVICGCNAGLCREALHEVYISRIQRGTASFAAKVLGARGALLSVLVHFVEHGRWDAPFEMGVDEQNLTAEDQLYILTEAGLYLTATQGLGAPEAQVCYQRAESLCHSLDRPLLLYMALIGQWRYTLFTDKLAATMQIAERIHRVAQEQNDLALMVGAHRALAVTLYFMGDFEAARKNATSGAQIWRSGGLQSKLEDVNAPAVVCLCYGALCEWHFGKIASCQASMGEAISLAKELNDMHGLALTLFWAAAVRHFERNPAAVEHLASDLVELSTRQNFAFWLAAGSVLRGWAQSASGQPAEGISRIEKRTGDFRATGSMLLAVPYWLALKAEALHLADRTSEALEAITEAEAFVKQSGERWWYADLHRLRGVFLAAIGGDERQIEGAFQQAIKIAKQQKSVSLTTRAEGSYAEYRCNR